MNNIRYFKYHSDYVSEESGLTNPNVSYCANQADVHYKVKDYRDEYLTFEALESGTFSLDIGSAVSTSVLSNISYSIDSGETWVLTNNVESQAVTITTPTVTAGNTVMWKGNGTGISTTINNNDRPSTSSIFSSTGAFNANGNILSLIYGDDFAEEDSVTGTYNFALLFYSYNTTKAAKIVSCEKIAMPIKNVSDFCYLRMFQGCTTLITAMKKIDAESIGNSSCFSTFNGCTSLSMPPELPAMSVGAQGYRAMFSGCSNLKKAPNLPCLSPSTSGYAYTFNDCTSLTTAPELPAMTLTDRCYYYMFSGCTSLTVAPELPATTLASYCYYGMFKGCTSLTIAPKLQSKTLASQCYMEMFYDCTNLTTAPELPATTLANQCYENMFYNCTSLTVAPELPATTLASYCYNSMFYGCTNLNYIKCLTTNISATLCTTNWVNGVAASGTFTKTASMTDWSEGVSGIPNGWTVKDAT